jgi:uncharacterized protein YwgA
MKKMKKLLGLAIGNATCLPKTWQKQLFFYKKIIVFITVGYNFNIFLSMSSCSVF